MAIESITRTNAVAMGVKPVETKPVETKSVNIQPVASAADMHAPVKEAQGSKKNMHDNKDGEEEGKEKQKQNASKQQIASAVKHANNQLKKTGCQFSYHEETKRVSITVIDK